MTFSQNIKNFLKYIKNFERLERMLGAPTSVGPHCMVYGGGISNLGARAAYERA